jgi:toxin-antitoxin system PIN domain toxin
LIAAMLLFDINVLIALGDRDHVHRTAALDLLKTARTTGWATCPLIENGFLRILGHPNYPQGPGSPQIARTVLASLTSQPGHQFWSDDFSLLDRKAFPSLPAAKNLTDYYLLALAVRHHARFATLDRRIDPALIRGGAAAFHLIHDS